MSCKEKPSKNKHYTLLERKVFLQILEKYKNVIELKKCDSMALKEKDTAWNKICEEYNQSALISQDRTVQQLKKLWSNLKQSQRDALTKEKQSRLATGGGPQETEANIDPDILNIAPHLMKTAPVLFTSNMTETEIEENRELACNIITINENVDVLDATNKDFSKDENNIRNVDSQDKYEFALNVISDKNENDTNKEHFTNNDSNGNIVNVQDKHVFALNISDKNINDANKEHFTNDDNDVKIVDSQDMLTLKRYNRHSDTTDIQRKKKKCINQGLLKLDTEETLRKFLISFFIVSCDI